MFSESGGHPVLPIYHSRAMTEPVFRDAVVVFVISPASQWLSCCTYEYVGHLMFSLFFFFFFTRKNFIEKIQQKAQYNIVITVVLDMRYT